MLNNVFALGQRDPTWPDNFVALDEDVVEGEEEIDLVLSAIIQDSHRKIAIINGITKNTTSKIMAGAEKSQAI